MSRIRHFQMGNGHHRFAAAFELEKQGHDIHLPLAYDRRDMRYDVNTFGEYNFPGQRTINPQLLIDFPVMVNDQFCDVSYRDAR